MEGATTFQARETMRRRAEHCRERALSVLSPVARRLLEVAAWRYEIAAAEAMSADQVERQAEDYERALKG